MLTACVSIFAYIWLLIIVVWSTPGVITLAEAVLTFVFFWILLAFAAPLPSIDGVAVRASSAFDDATDGDVWTERRFGDTLNAPVRPTSESTRQSTFRTPFAIRTRVRDHSIAFDCASI